MPPVLPFNSNSMQFQRKLFSACLLLGLIFTWLFGQAPSNDSPCGAISLTMDATVAINNTHATCDLNEVSPGSGNTPNSCASQKGWCGFETEAQTSLYFKFQAPVSGCVSILADGFDTQIAVWEVTNCADYSTFTKVAANDDSGFQLGGCIGSAGLIETACLIPGQEYYIQLDGHNGAKGQGTLSLSNCGNDPLEVSITDCQTLFTGLSGANPDTAYLRARPRGGFSPYTISWSQDPSVLFENEDSIGIAVLPTQSTPYTVSITDAKGCTVSEFTTVEVANISCTPSSIGLSNISGGRNRRARVQMCDGTTDHCILESDVTTYLNQGYTLGSCSNTCNTVEASFPEPVACVPLQLQITGDFFAAYENSWTLTDLTTNQTVDSRSTVIYGTQTFSYCVDPTHCYDFTLLDNMGDGFSFGGGYSLTFNGQSLSSNFISTTPSSLYSESEQIGSCTSKGANSSPENLISPVTTSLQVFPNPFAESATINFQPETSGPVKLEVISLSGQIVAVLFEGIAESGTTYSRQLSGTQLENGMFFYRLASPNGRIETGKILHQK